MAEENKPFNRKSIFEKRKEQQEEQEKKLADMRLAFETVASTPNGEKILRYLFILCGGDSTSVRRDKNGKICEKETLLMLGAKSVYETIRCNLSSESIQKIERHAWEK